MKVLLVGGGTGGHLYPLLNVTRKLKEIKGNKVKFLYIGPKNKYSEKILEANGIPVKGIYSAKFRRYFSIKNLLDFFIFPIGLMQSFIYVLFFMPDVVFSKGGYGSISPTIAARIYWIPILIHESDTVPGIANKWMSKIADKVAIYFEGSKDYFKKDKVFLAGNPVREDINQGSVERAVQVFNLRNNKPVIFILGGSQGSEFINEKIIDLLPKLTEKYQLIHQVGDDNFEKLKQFAQKKNIDLNDPDYHPYEYLGDEIIHAYRVATIAITRAGATTIAELAATQKPCILVPLSSGANSHQIQNAYYVGKHGGAYVIEENNFKGDLLLHRLNEIIQNDYLLNKMSNAMGSLHYPQASIKIVEALLYLSKEI